MLQADCAESEIRLDGRLRAKALMRSQGIILSLDSVHGPLSWACDRYLSWEDNLRAIDLTMQALRAVSRYGVVREAEQYKGFKSLPGPATPTAGGLTQAAAWLSNVVTQAGLPMTPQQILASVEFYEQARRKARAACHPDRHAGDQTRWNQLSQTLETLNGHHGLAD